MIKITFSEAESAALRHWRYHHPDPRIPMRMEALYWRSQGVPDRDILRLCGISKASFHRSLTAYVAGGMEPLTHRAPRPLRSALHRHRQPIEADFQQRPPVTVAEAAARIAALTGIARQPTQVRQFLKALGMPPRTVGMIPAKADVEAQETYNKTRWRPAELTPQLATESSASWLPPMLCLRLCRKFSCGDALREVDPVGGGIRRRAHRTVQPL
jgi:transposase